MAEGKRIPALEPDWLTGNLDGYPCDLEKPKPGGPLQQGDLFKPFFYDIGNFGLNYVYHKFRNKSPDYEKFQHTKTKHPRDVLIIGAGMAGLVTGYELAQVGHSVTILERQHRVGGRVKTLSDEHYYKGLWTDGVYMAVARCFSYILLQYYLDNKYI